jgi:hypothetical protein
VSTTAKLLLLAALAGYVVLRGIVPAWSGIDADFPSYFTAAKIVADRGDAGRLYDDYWFREQMRRYGLESARNPGKFAPFPPPTALLLVPLASLEPLTALRVVTAVSVLALVLAVLLVARMFSWELPDGALYILCGGIGILSCLRFGQPYIVISMFCLLGYYLYLKGRPWLAGLSLGLFVPVKYYPVIVLAVLAVRREWQVVLGGALAILAVALVSIGVLGWPLHEQFLLKVFGNHLTGHLTLREHTLSYTASYQSFDTLFNRLFVFDALQNPRPLWDAPGLRTVLLVSTKLAILCAAIAALLSLARQERRSAAAPAIGILGVLVLLIAPATATYTCLLLWLPVALLAHYFLSRGIRAAAYLVLGTYALMGFLPYGHTYPFEGRGGLTVLAYPRLFVLLVMFCGCVYFITRGRLPDKQRAVVAV